MITADVIGSTLYRPEDRRRLDRALRTAFRDTEARFPGAVRQAFGFRISAGDEFQGVVTEVPKALRMVVCLRSTVATSGIDPIPRFRASIGLGVVVVVGGTSSYEEDGQPFARSREGLDRLGRLRRSGRWTAIVTGHADVDSWFDPLLALMDHLQRRWTRAQWEAVRWAVTGLTREEIASRIGIRHQSATKRLAAAGWAAFDAGLRCSEQQLARVAAGL